MKEAIPTHFFGGRVIEVNVNDRNFVGELLNYCCLSIDLWVIPTLKKIQEDSKFYCQLKIDSSVFVNFQKTLAIFQ